MDFIKRNIQPITTGENFDDQPRIDGLTWYHHQIPEKIQLVVSKVHKVNHLGGNTLWGDGIR
ncbi:HNH endonuclease [Bacillus sp. S13(2024)]|uniref:HNH endonuclease n=1 Tax=unclassified Bacillus (in: firmicutes) TaxID=185979 RepID=UPI003D1EF4AD